MRLHILFGKSLQPGILVRGEYAVRSSGLRQHFRAIENNLILERLKCNPGLAERCGYRGITPLGLWLIVTIGENRRNAKRASQFW